MLSSIPLDSQQIRETNELFGDTCNIYIDYDNFPGILMATHPAATTPTFQNIEMIISGAAPFGSQDIKKILDKAQVF